MGRAVPNEVADSTQRRRERRDKRRENRKQVQKMGQARRFSRRGSWPSGHPSLSSLRLSLRSLRLCVESTSACVTSFRLRVGEEADVEILGGVDQLFYRTAVALRMAEEELRDALLASKLERSEEHTSELQ